MKDYLGNELEVGDEVVFVAPKYRMFATGKISRFANTKIDIEYINTWNYGVGGKRLSYRCGQEFVVKAVCVEKEVK